MQDAYSLRCAPAVHGASPRRHRLTPRRVAEAEINAATDNPLFFPGDDGGHDGEPWDFRFRANWPEGYHGEQRISYSAGNFHGEPVGMAADFLAIARGRAGEHLRAAHPDAARRATTTATCRRT